MVFVKGREPWILMLEVEMKQSPHQIIIEGDSGPCRWFHRREPRVNDPRSEIRLDVLGLIPTRGCGL